MAITTSPKISFLRKRYLDRTGLDVLLVDIMPTEQHDWDFPHRVHNGLRSILSFLKSKGYSAEILFNLDPGLSPRTVRSYFIKEIIRRKPLFLGFSPYQAAQSTISPDILRIEKIANNLHIKEVFPYIILGGHFASFTHKELMEDFPWIDFIIRGEGEESFDELIVSMKKHRPLKNVLGLTFKTNDAFIINPPRPNIKDLDCLPFPALDSLELVKEKGIPIKHVSLCSSRGCYGRCSFCSIQGFYGLSLSKDCWRAKSPKRVIDEIELLANKFNCRVFTFMDDNFMGPGLIGKKRAVGIAQEIINRKLNIMFSILCRPNDIDKNVLGILKKAGLYSVEIGIESGSDHGLITYLKDVTAAQNKEALITLNNMGIRILMDIIFFNPYSSLAEIKANINFYRFAFALRNFFHIDDRLFNSLTVFSGTRIKEQLEMDNLLKGNYIKGYAFKFKDKRLIHISKICSVFNMMPGIYNALIAGFSQDKRQISKLNSEKINICRDFALKSIEQAINILGGPSPYKISDFINIINDKLTRTAIDLKNRGIAEAKYWKRKKRPLMTKNGR